MSVVEYAWSEILSAALGCLLELPEKVRVETEIGQGKCCGHGNLTPLV